LKKDLFLQAVISLVLVIVAASLMWSLVLVQEREWTRRPGYDNDINDTVIVAHNIET